MHFIDFFASHEYSTVPIGLYIGLIYVYMSIVMSLSPFFSHPTSPFEVTNFLVTSKSYAITSSQYTGMLAAGQLLGQEGAKTGCIYWDKYI